VDEERSPRLGDHLEDIPHALHGSDVGECGRRQLEAHHPVLRKDLAQVGEVGLDDVDRCPDPVGVTKGGGTRVPRLEQARRLLRREVLDAQRAGHGDECPSRPGDLLTLRPLRPVVVARRDEEWPLPPEAEGPPGQTGGFRPAPKGLDQLLRPEVLVTVDAHDPIFRTRCEAIQ